MSYDNIIEKLKNLQSIKPDDNFKSNTRRKVLALEPKQSTVQSYIPTWSWAIGFAVILIAGSTLLITPNTEVSSFDSKELQNELNSLNIEIKEISYTQETSQTIASALDEISNTKANHLNKSILEKEQNSLEGFEGDSENINQMLNRVIF